MGGSWDAIDQELPVTLIQVNKAASDGSSTKKRFEFNEKVEKLFSASDVSDLKIAVISVAGIMRAGKSFLMSFLLRYATYMYYKPEARPEKPVEEMWMGDDDTELCGGFKWRHAVKRQTNGILMWPNLFKCTLQNGETVCIMILDTQGTHDGETTSSLWSSVFALSTLISSLQMYNVMRVIGEEQLQNLELHCGYGKLISEFSAGESSYQNLMFVVRDFKYGMEYPFGIGGGESYLQDQVVDLSSYTKQSQAVRHNIMGSFEQLSCCVLPDPGIRVMEQRDFNGKMREIDKRFRDVVKTFVPMVLTPENLVLKKVQGQLVTTRQLFDYIRVWVDRMNEANFPKPNSLLKSSVINDHIRSMEGAFEIYHTKMEAIMCTNGCYMDSAKLETIHLSAFDSAMMQFFTTPMLGRGGEMTEVYQKKLEGYMNEKYQEYCDLNTARVEILENAIRTPITVFICIAFCTVFEWLGFTNAHWIKLVFYAALLQWLKDVFIGGIKRLREIY
uniref:Atlastin-2 n=1 Tax=Lygus hesperus TaxID=30085 RepID=A0A0A9Z7H3_LYGHE